MGNICKGNKEEEPVLSAAVLKCNYFFDNFEYKEKPELKRMDANRRSSLISSDSSLTRSSSFVGRVVKEDIRNIY